MARKVTTRFIGIRELRNNLSKLLKEARKKNIHFVVMRFDKIAGYFTPPTEEEYADGILAEERTQKPPKSREDIKRFLQEARELKLSFPGHDGVAYQRHQRS